MTSMASRSLTSPRRTVGISQIKIKAGAYLHKSQLLFGWLRSTIPGLGQVRDGGARGSRRFFRKRSAFSQVPDHPKDLRAPCLVALFPLDQLLNRYVEHVHSGSGIVPRIAQRPWIERLYHAADFGRFQQQRAFGNQQPNGKLNGSYLIDQVEVDKLPQKPTVVHSRCPGRKRNERG